MGDFDILEHATILPMEKQALRFPLVSDDGLRMGQMCAVKTDVQSFFLTGDGIDKPLGILGGYVGGDPVTHLVPRWGAGTICADDLITMRVLHCASDACLSQPGCVRWLINPSAYELVAKLRDATGVYFLNKRGHLLGFPAHEYEQSPGLGEVGDVLLADFSAYIIGRHDHDGETWYDGMPTSSVVQTSSGPMYRFVALGEGPEW